MFRKLKLLLRYFSKKKYPAFEKGDAAVVLAKDIVKKFPPVDTLNINTNNATVNGTYEALIVGFDVYGNSILRKLIEAAQFVGAQFKVTVMVNEISKNVERFCRHYPELKNHYAIDFMDCKMGSKELSAWFQQHGSKLKHIIISTGNDKKNRTMALELDSLLINYSIPIIVVTRKKRNALKNCAGNIEPVFIEKKILKSNYLHQAKAIHNFYNKLKPFAQRIPWEQLSDMKKESNIAVSESLYAKLKLMGKTTDEIKQMSEAEFQLFLQENPDRLLNLAIAEHLRWNATYFANGWRTWHLPEIPENAPHLDETQKLHACLVDWDTLKEVEKRFDIPFQQYDYNNIFIIRQLLVNNVLIS